MKPCLTGNDVKHCYFEMASLFSNSKNLAQANPFKSCASVDCIFVRSLEPPWPRCKSASQSPQAIDRDLSRVAGSTRTVTFGWLNLQKEEVSNLAVHRIRLYKNKSRRGKDGWWFENEKNEKM